MSGISWTWFSALYGRYKFLREGKRMKLVFAIVHDEDGSKVMEELNKNGFGVTKLCSTGGFLKAGNTTLLVGVDEEHLDNVIDVIKKKSRSRKQVINSSMTPNGMGGMFIPYPVEVVVGGATIFVLDVERFEKA
jgi:uncharacterized protein YaaQ